MGAIGGLFGTAGGASGTGYQKPGEAANLTPTTNANQLGNAYTGVTNSLGSQQALLDALQGQQGLTQQSNMTALENSLTQQQSKAGNIGNQTAALQSQQGLNSQLAGLNGAANQQNVFGQGQTLASQMAGANGVSNLSGALASQQNLAAQQQALIAQQQATAGQYQNIANGTGPNPAQAALNQSTGQNIASQAALMAGQRGAGANVGLMARQAAQQGAATQQQAVGQSATMQAQQQIAGLSGLAAQQQAIGQTTSNIGQTNTSVGNIAAQQIAQQQAQQQALSSQAQQQVAQQQTGINAAQQAASGMTAQQMAQQQALAGQINTVAGQQIAQTNAGTQAQFQQQAAQQQAGQAMNANQVGMQSNINNANAGLAQTSMTGQQGVVGGVMGGVGKVLLGAKGGIIPHMADGGAMDAMTPPPVPNATPVPEPMAQPPGAQSSFGKFIQGYNAANQQQEKKNSPLQQGMQDFTSGVMKKLNSSAQAAPAATAPMAEGSDVGALGEAATMAAAKGGVAQRQDYRAGGHVKAKNEREKAVKAGDSYANDKIPAMLSEHEIVIPRHITQGKDPVKGAADFVAKVLAKRKRA